MISKKLKDLKPDTDSHWDVVIVGLNMTSDKVKATAETLYAQASSMGLDVLFDDRSDSAGVKLKDADLLGIPWRIVIGDRKLATDQVELQSRRDKSVQDLSVSEVLPRLKTLLVA